MISGPRKRKARQAEASADAPPQRNAGVPRRAKALTREGSEGTGSRSLEQPRRRLQHLYEVSKLLTRFENVETTVRAIIAIVNQTLALRTAILIFESAGRPQSLVWHGEGESAPQLHTAMSNARASYAYLAGPAGAGSTSSTSRAEVNEPAGQMFGSSSTKNFIAIPLVVEHSRIFGAFQLETVDRPDELDLLLINAVANRLAVALDRQAAIEAGQAAAEARTQHAEHRQITAEAARAHAESREAAARAEQMEAERRRDAARVEREAEELRRASAEALHERYEALVDNIDHAFVWEADARTLRVFYVSARAEMLLGYPRQSWLTDPEFWMRRVHPEDRDELAQTFRRALAEKKDQRHDHRCVTADGRILWFHTGVHLAQANSPAPQLQGVSVDITPMKHADVSEAAEDESVEGIARAQILQGELAKHSMN
jgi:PAS domain S-box-containing protein